MLLKTATGDFNHDGYENEIAVLACDANGITLSVYQITCNNNTKQFSIKEMADAGTIFKYNLSDYYKLIGYNGFNRAPGADVLAGDFDGDGQTEIAAVFFGDFPNIDSSLELVMSHGGTSYSLNANIYKWNNSTGKFDVTASKTDKYAMGRNQGCSA